MYLNIQKGSSFNQLIYSGSVHPTVVLIANYWIWSSCRLWKFSMEVTIRYVSCYDLTLIINQFLADELQPRNINISFNNNSNLAIDMIVFIFYGAHILQL